MADAASITRRSAFLSQALSTLGGSPEWDRKLSKYLAAEALAYAQREFGEARDAFDSYERGVAALQKAFGKHFKTEPSAKAVYSALWQALREAEDRLTAQFYYPMWDAASDLAKVPAPSLAAALFKVSLAEMEGLGTDGDTADQMFGLVADDMAQFVSGEA